jgi:type I restriction enzyme R subunit
MSTGVDAQTCHPIALDKRITSITEFKQIIGRGTRINEDYNKLYFRITDFKQATALFADPAFDGDPVQIYQPRPDQPAVPPEVTADDGEQDGPGATISDFPVGPDAPPDRSPTKYYVDEVEVAVATERVQYLGEDGRLITESLKDYSRKALRKEYASLDQFLNARTEADRKQVILEELAAKGVFIDELAEHVGRDYDAFDLVCYVAYDRPPLTRRERADRVRKQDLFGRYSQPTRAVLQALLDKYSDGGIRSLESLEILKVDPLTRLGTPIEIIQLFGGKEKYLAAVHELETQLYLEAA